MKRLNSYKITSGGYIFDQLDRIAQAFVVAENPEYQYWLTASANIWFLRQTTPESRKDIRVESIKRSWRRPNRVKATIALTERNGPMIAYAVFLFVGKNHLHKGGKNDKN